MDELDYWRLCDELNITQAALLVVDVSPSSEEGANCESWNWKKQHKSPRGYEAAKTAIISGIRTGVIKGVIVPHLVHDSDGDPNPYGLTIEGSVNLTESRVEVASLRTWLVSRGFKSGFFLSVAINVPDYLDPLNPRYAPKLAAAVRAWQAVTDPGRKSPKQALEKWLRENAVQFGLVDDEGNPVAQAVEECSKVANWNQSGGAPKTPSS